MHERVKVPKIEIEIFPPDNFFLIFILNSLTNASGGR